MSDGIAGRTVLIAGATSASGAAATRVLRAAGAHVVAVGRDAAKLTPLAALGARTEVADLADGPAVADLRTRLADDGVRVDGILHLVGGWRGGGGLPGQSDDDFAFLEGSLTALRHVTRAFWDDLLASPAARVGFVSSPVVERPLAGGANYATVKAAGETWMRAVAQGFSKAARDASAPLSAAAVIFRVRELAGLEDSLATAFAALWDGDAAGQNGQVIPLPSEADA